MHKSWNKENNFDNILIVFRNSEAVEGHGSEYNVGEIKALLICVT